MVNWLVVEPYPSEKYDFVSWDDDIPNWIEIIQMFQTTNQNMSKKKLGRWRKAWNQPEIDMLHLKLSVLMY